MPVLSFFLNFRCKKARCRDDIVISTRRAITAMAVSPNAPQLAIGCSDSTVQIYDRRYLANHIGGYFNHDFLTCRCYLVILQICILQNHFVLFLHQI